MIRISAIPLASASPFHWQLVSATELVLSAAASKPPTTAFGKELVCFNTQIHRAAHGRSAVLAFNVYAATLHDRDRLFGRVFALILVR